MNIFDIDLDDDFSRSFTSSAGAVTDCHCGREHVCINSNYFDPEDEHDAGMIADYHTRDETDENLVLDYEYDSQTLLMVGDKWFVYGCECEGWKPYMNFIIQHRRQIRDFLVMISDRAEQALEHEKSYNILKNKEL